MQIWRKMEHCDQGRKCVAAYSYELKVNMLGSITQREKVHRLWEGFDEEWTQPGVIYME
jgi:hypothetical protein